MTEKTAVLRAELRVYGPRRVRLEQLAREHGLTPSGFANIALQATLDSSTLRLGKLAAVSLAALALTACATRPVSNAEAEPVPQSRVLSAAITQPTEGSVRVVIKRDSGFNTGACSTRVYLNGSPVADIRTAEKVTLYVQPGEHILSAQPTGICGGGMQEVRTILRPGMPQNFRIGYDSAGSMTLGPTAF